MFFGTWWILDYKRKKYNSEPFCNSYLFFFRCRHPGCQKAFSQLSNLQSHSRCHQTDKPYKCNSCYKCFSDEPSLLEHIPKHKESKHLKTHICQYCGKSYTQETYLSKHMQKHAERTDKRPPIGPTLGEYLNHVLALVNCTINNFFPLVVYPDEYFVFYSWKSYISQFLTIIYYIYFYLRDIM